MKKKLLLSSLLACLITNSSNAVIQELINIINNSSTQEKITQLTKSGYNFIKNGYTFIHNKINTVEKKLTLKEFLNFNKEISFYDGYYLDLIDKNIIIPTHQGALIAKNSPTKYTEKTKNVFEAFKETTTNTNNRLRINNSLKNQVEIHIKNRLLNSNLQKEYISKTFKTEERKFESQYIIKIEKENPKEDTSKKIEKIKVTSRTTKRFAIATKEDLELSKHNLCYIKELKNKKILIISTNNNETFITKYSIKKDKDNEKYKFNIVTRIIIEDKIPEIENKKLVLIIPENSNINGINTELMLYNKDKEVLYIIDKITKKIERFKNCKITNNKTIAQYENLILKDLSLNQLLLYINLINQKKPIDLRYSQETDLYKDFYKLPLKIQNYLVNNNKVKITSKYNPLVYLNNLWNSTVKIKNHVKPKIKSGIESTKSNISRGCSKAKEGIIFGYNTTKDKVASGYKYIENKCTQYLLGSINLSNISLL